MQPKPPATTINLETLNLPLGPEHPCPYIDGYVAQERACRVTTLGGGIYHKLMDHGWRRSGHILYKPFCPGCNQCQAIRIPVARFSPSKSQRRILKKNADIRTNLCVPATSDEKFELFVRYQKGRHDGTMCTVREDYEEFLYKSPLKTVEMEFHLEGRLIGSAIMDFDDKTLSAVYNYFDPTLRDRSLGTFAILKSIELARDRRDEYYYMGYYIENSDKMTYKKLFKPSEILCNHKIWRDFNA